MAKQLRVKAVLQYPEGLELGCRPDIRRFKLPKGGDSEGDLYHHLVDTLPKIFPDVTGLSYSLYWKDGDDDLVQLSTMAELQTAIDSMSDNVLALYVLVDLQGTDTTGTESDREGEESPKRVRFYRAGKRWRRRLRRRRRAAFTDDEMVSKEYRKGVRHLVRQLHRLSKGVAKGADPSDIEEKTTLAALSPEVQAFVRQIFEDWHTQLSQKRPRVVAKRIRKGKRSLPSGLEKDHFRWLCRFMGRWHRRNPGKCDVMAGWSSGETGDDTSGDEETLIQRQKKRGKGQVKKGEKQEVTVVSESEDTDGAETSDHKVPKDFRKDVRVLMNQLHKKKEGNQKEKTTLPTLSPEAQTFIQKLASDWHTKLTRKRPRVVARRTRKEKRDLPSGLEKDHFRWLCRFMARWHRRNAGKCDVMAGWSSGVETEEDGSGGEEEMEKRREKRSKMSRTKGQQSQGAGSDSDDADTEEEKDVSSKAFRKDIRVMINQLHRKKKAVGKGDKPEGVQGEKAVSVLSPEVQTFIQDFVEEWHTKLSTKRPRVVARRMRKAKRNLPSDLEKDNFRWLCRIMARWHHRHAGKCDVMSGWSSGETGDDTSGDEEVWSSRPYRKSLESDGLESEDTDCLEKACKPVSKDFRTDVRKVLVHYHKDKQTKEPDTPTLSPEVLKFLQQFSQEWHARLAQKRPHAVSKEMKEGERSLPSRMEREQYTWLCCFMARWHRKHAGKCDVMSGWMRGDNTTGPDA